MIRETVLDSSETVTGSHRLLYYNLKLTSQDLDLLVQLARAPVVQRSSRLMTCPFEEETSNPDRLLWIYPLAKHLLSDDRRKRQFRECCTYLLRFLKIKAKEQREENKRKNPVKTTKTTNVVVCLAHSGVDDAAKSTGY